MKTVVHSVWGDTCLARPGKTKLALLGAVLAYAIFLEWSYRSVIRPRFAYSGFRYEPAHWTVRVAVWGLLLIVAFLLPYRLKRPSDIVLWIVYAIVVAPTLLTSSFMSVLSDGEALLLSFGMGVSMILLTWVVGPQSGIQRLTQPLSPTSFWLLIAVWSALFYAYLFAVNGVQIRWIAFADVYSVRSKFGAVRANAPLMGYLMITQANVINPLILVKGLASRRWPIIGAGLLAQFALYSASGNKSMLFSVVAVGLVWLMFRIRKSPTGSTVVAGMASVIVVSTVYDNWRGGVTLTTLFVRRFLVLHGYLSQQYYDFYSTSGFEYLGHSILEPFGTSPHPYRPANMVSVHMVGHPNVSMNASFLATGYADAGFVGMLVASIALGVYLRLLNRAVAGLPQAVGAAVAVMPAISLSSTGVHTAMLTSGLVVLLILLALSPRGGWGRGDAAPNPTRKPRSNERASSAFLNEARKI